MPATSIRVLAGRAGKLVIIEMDTPRCVSSRNTEDVSSKKTLLWTASLAWFCQYRSSARIPNWARISRGERSICDLILARAGLVLSASGRHANTLSTIWSRVSINVPSRSSASLRVPFSNNEQGRETSL